MKLVVFILNRTDALEYLLEDLASAGVKGATILQSQGMAMTLAQLGSSSISQSIKSLFSPKDEYNRTIFMVAHDEQVPIIKKVITHSVGDLNEPNTGIFFTMPIDSVEGMTK